MILTQGVPREIQKYPFSLQVETSYVAFVLCSRINISFRQELVIKQSALIGWLTPRPPENMPRFMSKIQFNKLSSSFVSGNLAVKNIP